MFDENKFKIFLGMGGHFLFNDVKLPEKFIYDIQFVEKCSIRGVLANFCRKGPIWAPIDLEIILLIHH